MPHGKTKLGHFVSDDSRFILLKIIPRTNTRVHRRFVMVAFDADMCLFFFKRDRPTAVLEIPFGNKRTRQQQLFLETC